MHSLFWRALGNRIAAHQTELPESNGENLIRLVLWISLFYFVWGIKPAAANTETLSPHSNYLINIYPGFDQVFHWQSPQVYRFTLDYDGADPLLITFEERGTYFQLSGLDMSIGNDISLDADIGYSGIEYIALTAAESRSAEFLVSEHEFFNSVADFRITVSRISVRDPSWLVYRNLTYASVVEHQELNPNLCGASAQGDDTDFRLHCARIAQRIAAQRELSDLAGYAMFRVGAEHYRRNAYDRVVESMDMAMQQLGTDHLIGAIAGVYKQIVLFRRGDSAVFSLLDELKAGVTSLARRHPDHLGIRYFKLSLANRACLTLFPRNLFTEAGTCFSALLPQVSAGQDSLLAVISNNLANVLLDTGKIPEAEKVWVDLLQDYPDVNDRDRALWLNNLGRARWRLRKLTDAISAFEQSRNLVRQANQRFEHMRTSFYLARLYSDVGRPDRAESLYSQVMEEAANLDIPSWIHHSLNQKARLATQQGDMELALDLYRSASKLAEERYITNLDGSSLLTWAELYIDLGEFGQAEELLDRAIQLPEIQNITLHNAYYHLLQGRVELAQDELVPALVNMEQSQSLFKVAEDSYWYAIALAWRARTVNASGDVQAALKLVAEAQEAASDLRNELITPDLRAGYSQKQRQIYDAAVAINLDAWKALGEQKYLDQAARYAEQSKAQTLLEESGQREFRRDIPTDIRERRQRLSEALNAASITRYEANRDNLAANLVSAINSNYYQRLQELEAFDQAHGISQAVTVDSRLNLESIAANVSPDEWVVSYYLLGERLLRFEYTAQGITVDESNADVGENHKNTLINILRRPGGYRSAGYRHSSQALARLILPADLDRRRVKTLRISADGWVWSVPFSALPLNPGPQKNAYLIDSFEVMLTPSLAWNQSAAQQLSKAEQLKVAVFADPIFDPADQRITAATDKSPIEAGFGSTLSRLPGSLEEARWIKELGGVDAQLYIGESASRDMLIGFDGRRLDVLHIATHGIFSRKLTSVGGLAMSRYNSQGQALNWFISPQDIAAMRWPLRLVFMSACESGQGEEILGEGVVGITRAFQYAGAENVISSTWKVADRGTRAFVKTFYAKLTGNNYNVVAALAGAARDIKQDPRFRDPYYWSGFILHAGGVNSQLQ